MKPNLEPAMRALEARRGGNEGPKKEGALQTMNEATVLQLTGRNPDRVATDAVFRLAGHSAYACEAIRGHFEVPFLVAWLFRGHSKLDKHKVS